MKRRWAALAGLGCATAFYCATLCCATSAHAETVKIIVPFAAGGPVDQLARILTPELSQQLGADVIVDDRGGAGGAIGSRTGRPRQARRHDDIARQHGLAGAQSDPEIADGL